MPLYRAVKRALLRAIEDGTLAPGATLPSEAALAAGFGVAIGTLRQAVGELVAEHVLVRRQGRGTFVATHSAERFLFQFFHVERGDGLRQSPQVELIGFERGRLDDEAVFYLRSRGLDRAEAQRLLVQAFAGEILDRIREPELRERLAALVADKLAVLTTTGGAA